MKKWLRTIEFESGEKQQEVWTSKDSCTERIYNVMVRHGKKTDIANLKKRFLKDLKNNIRMFSYHRKKIFKEKSNLETVRNCPICKADSGRAVKVFMTSGASYHQCRECSHVYIKQRPSKQAIEKYYSECSDYHAFPDNDEADRQIIEQITRPKADWLIDEFKRVYGRKPLSILDIGTGLGHFVKVCRDYGIKTDGIEPNNKAREYCRKHFGIELLNKDFIKGSEAFSGYEILTFWGVIEHVPEPMELLKAASRALSGKGGLVVVHVPRWGSFSTAVQNQFSDSITRHLDPLGHINCFTDSSLATSLEMNNFEVISAWYLGMDFFELVTQLSFLMDDERVISFLGSYIPSLQQSLDQAKLSDEMVFIGKTAGVDGAD